MIWPGHRPIQRRFRFPSIGNGAEVRNEHRRIARTPTRSNAKRLFLLALCTLSLAADRPPGNLIYHPSLGFQIPFEIDPADKPFLKSIELYVSDNLGKSWRLSTATTPNSKAFKFRAVVDGEYWFAVRTLDVEGRYNPADDKPIVPDWRVIVDSKKPGLGLRTIARRGSTAILAWDARDENLDMGTFVLEYSIPGSGDWKPVPIGRPAPNGETTWDSGTAEAILVRATVSDKAGNVQHAETQFSDGTPQRPELSAKNPVDMDGQAPAPIARMASAAGDRRGILGPHDPFAERESPPGEWIDTPRPYGPEAMTPATRGSETGRMPRMAGPGSGLAGAAGSNPPIERRQVPLLNSPRFPMNYVVEDAGPNGPASVELWVTRDGGKNWSRWSEDEDRASPMMVDLGGEGVFGLSIVARSIAGQGDEIPRTGTPPQLVVEIDSTPPAMILNVIKVGVGSQSGKVLISWQAEDRSFGQRPISLFYRPETGNQWLPIVENLENTGQYVWTPGPQVPPVFHVRVEARDGAGNRSAVDTTQYEPVLLDRSRPKGRILGISLNQSEPPAASPTSENPTVPASSKSASASPEPVGSRPSSRIEPIIGTGESQSTSAPSQPAPPPEPPSNPDIRSQNTSSPKPAPKPVGPENNPEKPSNGFPSIPPAPTVKENEKPGSESSQGSPAPATESENDPFREQSEVPPPTALQDLGREEPGADTISIVPPSIPPR